MKKHKKLISVLVLVAIIFGCIPLSAFANEEEIPEIEQPLTPEAKITELVDRREESIKHFLMPDGSYDAVSYAGAVHRKDADGIWQDINNDLSIKTVGTKQLYTTDDSRLSFAKSYSPTEDIIELRENGYVIAMALLSSQNDDMSMDMNTTASLATVVNANAVRPDSFDSIEQAVEINNRSSIFYGNVMEDTDIEYVMSGNDIKENIIVKDRADSYVYAFSLSLDGLNAVLDENGAIYLNDTDTEETKYVIPAPYMYDNNDIYSEEVYYELIHVGGDKYLLTVTADEEWINDEEREFPVTIDPSVISDGPSKDTYIYSRTPNYGYGGNQAVAVDSQNISLIHIPLPNIHSATAAGLFSSAELYIRFYSPIENSSTTVAIHRILENWTENDATWGNQPEIEQTEMSYKTLITSSVDTSNNPRLNTVNITNATKYYYDTNKPYYGIAIALKGMFNNTIDESSSDHIGIKSRESGDAHEAFMIVSYTTLDIDETDENGETVYYYIQNRSLSTFLQIADSTDRIEANELAPDAGEEQKWQISYYGDGYYTVMSKKNNKYLSVRASGVNSSGSVLAHLSAPVTDKKLWRITKSSSGNYIFRPKSAKDYPTDWCMILKTPEVGCEISQKKYTDNATFDDEWVLAKIGYVSETATLEGQQTDSWCWVTAARMFANHYYKLHHEGQGLSATQFDAVDAVIRDYYREEAGGRNPYTESGDELFFEMAINYYLGVDFDIYSNPKGFITTGSDTPYSQSELINILQQENVIFIQRFRYVTDETGNQTYKAHATLIYGYVTINSQIWFLIRDPFLSEDFEGINPGEVVIDSSGHSYLMSYNKICNGQNQQTGETSDFCTLGYTVILTGDLPFGTEDN